MTIGKVSMRFCIPHFKIWLQKDNPYKSGLSGWRVFYSGQFDNELIIMCHTQTTKQSK